MTNENDPVALWNGNLDEAATQTLKAGVAAWAEHGFKPTPAAERLRRIRAVESALPKAALKGGAQVWQTRENPKRRAWRWLAAAAAVLVIGTMAYLIHARANNQKIAISESKPTEEKPAQEWIPVIAATAGTDSHGLFARYEHVLTEKGTMLEPSAGWRPLKPGDSCMDVELIQAAVDGKGGHLLLDQGKRIKLFPGSVAMISKRDKQHSLQLRLGRAEIQVEQGEIHLLRQLKGKCIISTTELEPFDVNPLVAVVRSGERVMAEAGPFAGNTFVHEGQMLHEVDNIPELDVKITREPLEPPKAPEPPAVAIQPGTANLLKVIKADLNGTADEVAAKLQEALGVRIKLSEAASQKAGGQAVALALGDVTGAEAVAALAEKAGLKVQVIEGEVVLELPDEKRNEPKDEAF